MKICTHIVIYPPDPVDFQSISLIATYVLHASSVLPIQRSGENYEENGKAKRAEGKQK